MFMLINVLERSVTEVGTVCSNSTSKFKAFAHFGLLKTGQDLRGKAFKPEFLTIVLKNR